VREVIANEFNCRGAYSDDATRRCPELDYVRTDQALTGAFRTPSLRNLDNTAPFMHQGQIATLAGVLEHYNTAPLAMIGHNEAKPLKLRRSELRQLEAFLLTLASPIDADDKWLRAPVLPLTAERDEEQ
jgi:cytochrome c peroxidase